MSDTFDGGFGEILAGNLVGDTLSESPAGSPVVQRLESQVGIDGARAVSDEEGKMMHLARLARLEHQTGACARAFADQVMMYAGDGEQSGDGRQFVRVNPRSESTRMLMPSARAADAWAQRDSIASRNPCSPSTATSKRIGRVRDLNPA